MRLTKATIATLPLPEDQGKADVIYWDDDLPRFGVRCRGASKKFVVQYRSGAGQRRPSLGDARVLDPDQARRAAKKLLAALTLGADPHAEKIEAKRRAAHTMGAHLARYLARKKASVRPRSYQPVELHLQRRAARFHDVPLHKIERRDVAAHLAEMGERFGPTAVTRARTVLGEFFAWCMGEGLMEGNPIIGTNDAPPMKPRERVLSDQELGQIWRACGDDDHGRIVHLLILTGCRKREIGGLRWDEIGADGMIRLPPERVKSGRPHVIPLLGLAAEIVEGIKACRLDNGRHLFSGGRGGGGGFENWHTAKVALDRRIAAAGKPMAPWCLHDLRRTFATRLGELGQLPHIIDGALGHRWGDRVGRTYNRAAYQREIEAAYRLWDAHVRSIIEGGERKVIALRA